jgi:hypothetical protein
MGERHLTDKDLLELDKNYRPESEWDGIERRKARNSCIDPQRDRRRK